MLVWAEPYSTNQVRELEQIQSIDCHIDITITNVDLTGSNEKTDRRSRVFKYEVPIWVSFGFRSQRCALEQEEKAMSVWGPTHSSTHAELESTDFVTLTISATV